MIVKWNNKQENFYQYMGKIFGSRVIQSKLNDRIYDDPNKEWYLTIEHEKVVAFVSISNRTIKNVYTQDDSYLIPLFQSIQKDMYIRPSVVTNLYTDVYEECGFIVTKDNYKNFVMIRGEQNNEKQDYISCS